MVEIPKFVEANIMAKRLHGILSPWMYSPLTLGYPVQ
jgi:hypothetical protein